MVACRYCGFVTTECAGVYHRKHEEACRIVHQKHSETMARLRNKLTGYESKIDMMHRQGRVPDDVMAQIRNILGHAKQVQDGYENLRRDVKAVAENIIQITEHEADKTRQVVRESTEDMKDYFHQGCVQMLTTIQMHNREMICGREQFYTGPKYPLNDSTIMVLRNAQNLTDKQLENREFLESAIHNLKNHEDYALALNDPQHASHAAATQFLGHFVDTLCTKLRTAGNLKLAGIIRRHMPDANPAETKRLRLELPAQPDETEI